MGADVDPDGTPLLDAHREQLALHVRRAEEVLLCLDFDGTLAPITASPADARMTPTAREHLERLARLDGVAVAVVSGRELSDVRERVGVPGIAYAGNHGLELRIDGERVVHPAASESRDAIQAVCGALADDLATVEGAVVENKGLTATVHYRRVDADQVDAVVERVERAVAGRDSLRLSEGKAVLEVRPAVDWGKGDAVEHLVEEFGDDSYPLAVYVGDDTTDESAFRAVRPLGVGILVGETARTAAACRLADPQAVAVFLGWLREVVRTDSGE